LVNLLEDKDHIYVEALTPGVDPKSINLTAMQNRLTLAGGRAASREISNRKRFIEMREPAGSLFAPSIYPSRSTRPASRQNTKTGCSS
jgi:HSP20 family molecular chaperone IbpA